MAISVEFVLGQFPEGFCIQTAQQFADALVALLQGTIGGSFSGIIISANPPAVTDQDKAWVKTDATGRPVGIYIYKGTWLWPHPVSASSSFRNIWVGSEAALWATDGGDGTDPSTNAPTAITGAMWQVDTALAFKVPMGAGTNSITYDGNAATTLAVTGAAGEERHTLAGNESLDSNHVHQLGRLDNAGQIDLYLRSATAVPAQAGNAYRVKGNGAETTQDLSALNKQDVVTGGLNSAATIVSHQNLPPVYGVYFVKRTARQYLTAS
jgi:hypothetical protein